MSRLFPDEPGKVHLFPYKWTLKDAVFTKDKGKVFSCFTCGGGSTMGYKLAGFDVIGCNEIDPKMMACYIENHNPKYSYLEPIQTFKDRDDLPGELYKLDILDGSPPCSSFSISGNRDKDWGKEKKFREGQKKQVLDTLFFDFIDLAKKLQPKVVIAENVKGLLMGSAYTYYRRIHKELNAAGYNVTAALLDASTMGVPQRRERVFVIGVRKDFSFKLNRLDMRFREEEITFDEIRCKTGKLKTSERQKLILDFFKTGDNCIADINQRIHKKLSGFNASIQYDNKVMSTIDSKSEMYRAFDRLHCTENELIKAGTYPLDYNFYKVQSHYLIGMSVPPVMTAQIATRIYDQILSKI